MFIQKVISYRNSWGFFKENFSAELDEILFAVNAYVSSKDNERLVSNREVWEDTLSGFGWKVLLKDRNMRYIGPIKNGVSALVGFSHPDYVTRWLFQRSTIAVKNGLTLPILLLSTREYMQGGTNAFRRLGSFEYILEELTLISPMAHNYPFLILGYSDKADDEEPEIFEIEQDEHVAQYENRAIDRFIEFPPEYHQAGLGILNYFGEYLRKQYPDQDAVVKIEQHGLKVRMIIETHDGQSEIIEKALEEYQLIVSGQEVPERIIENKLALMELKQELNIAKLRIEQQQDFIEYQKSEYKGLLELLKVGLSGKQNVIIDFNPQISISNSVAINQNITSTLCSINELKDIFDSSSPAYVALDELESSLLSLEKENNPGQIKNSPIMGKFKRILDGFIEDGSSLNTALDKAGEGIELLQDLAGKYNKIAEWCGLPQVPSVFTK